MKLYKSLILSVVMATGALALTGCQNSFDEPEAVVPEATMKPNTTIAELKAMNWKSDANYAELVGEKEDGEHYIIKGRVISSDACGNVYKALYIQDETDAITISVNQNSLYNDYRIGQEIVLDVTGLYLGKYAGLQQIGGLGYYNGTPQVSFVAYEVFAQHVQLNGAPAREMEYITYGSPRPTDGSLYCTVMSIGQLPTAEAEVRDMESQYVEFRNVHFPDGGKLTYADYQTNTSRNLMDAQGNTIVVRSSGYATFYNEPLPKDNGTVRGLLSYFNGTWQLVINSTADCIFDDKGQQNKPYTVAEAIELQGKGTTGWVKGYIVGSVKPVAAVSSNDDIIWSADADWDNNLVIAAAPDVKQYDQCLVIELPAGSELRKVANLADNPEAYGQEILLRGTFDEVLGTYGITGNSGNSTDFVFDAGTSPSNPSTGAGSEDSPFTVPQVVASTNDSTDVWVEGYIVGWIEGQVYTSGAHFNAETTVKTNLILAATPDETDPAKCIPVQLPAGSIRDDLSLAAKPELYKKHVKLFGEVSKYFSTRGLKNVSSFKLLD